MGKVNLPQSYFHCPELSKREKTYLIQKAQESAKALVEGARSSNGPIRWTEAGTQNGAQMYRGEARHASGEDVNYMCGATSVFATLEECAEFFDLSSTAKMKDFVATQDDVHDGVVLYTLAEPTEANGFMHQITVKWLLTNLMNPIKDRDFLTLECQDVFTDTTGRRGWVRSYHSIKLPCCPDMSKDMGFIRGSFYHSGYVFVESERPGYLDCIYSLQINLKGNLKLPQALYFAMMKRRIGTVGTLGQVIHERRLGKHKFLSDLELVPKHQRSRCQICAVGFGVLTRKTRCRKCGEVVCHACTQIWDINVPKFGAKKVRVCSKCCTATTQAAMSHVSGSERNSVSMGSEHQVSQTPSQTQLQSQNQIPILAQSSDDDRRRAPSYESVPSQYNGGSGAGPRSFASGSEPEYGQPVQAAFSASGAYLAYPPAHLNQLDAYPPHHHLQSMHQYAPAYPPRGQAPPPPTGYYPTDVYPGYEYNHTYQQQQQPLAPKPAYHHHHNHNQQQQYQLHQHQDKLRRTGLTEETASLSSDFSNSHGYEDRGLTPTLLEHHARGQAGGRPGYAPDRMLGPRGQPTMPPPPPPQHYYRGHGAPYARPPPPQGMTHGYASQEYSQPNYQRRMSYGSDHNSEVYREFHGMGYPTQVASPTPPAPAHRGVAARAPPPPLDVRSKASSHSSSEDGRRKQATPPPPQYQYQTQPLPNRGLSFGSDQYATPPSREEDDPVDEDAFDEASVYSPVSKAIADDFSSLLRVDADAGADRDSYRFSVTSSMMEPSISFCDTIADRDTHSQLQVEEEPDKRSAATASSTSNSSNGSSPAEAAAPPPQQQSSATKKVTVVQLYQQILELTKQQHMLDTAPEAEPAEKERVAKDLRQLYQRLNELTLNPEIEL